MQKLTIGMDLGDKKSFLYALDSKGQGLEEFTVMNTRKGIDGLVEKYKGQEVEYVMETGTHSRWISDLLRQSGSKVLVADARQIALITKSQKKTDRRDAEMLARLGRADRKLLHPVHHRSMQNQVDLALIKSRDLLTSNRTNMINYMRGILKSFGHRLPSCSGASFHKQAGSLLPEVLQDALNPVLELIQQCTDQIKRFEKQIKRLSETRYPETARVRQIKGVGPITSLAYVLTLEDPGRFRKSRSVGSYLGMTPRVDQSGNSDKQLRISKAGNSYLRQLLVSCAHYILGPFGEPCHLRAHGEKIMARGGKNAKKRAVVAVARKLGVLMHVLWRSGREYDPLIHLKQQAA